MTYKNHPAFKLRKWISSELIESEVIYAESYNGIDPVIPVQDIDELAEKLGSLPYMFYYSIPMPKANRQQVYKKEELLYINVIANNYAELAGMVSFLIDLLDRQDFAAEDANKRVEDGSVRFLTISLEKSGEVYQTTQPTGRFIQEVCFCYEYVREIKPNGRML